MTDEQLVKYLNNFNGRSTTSKKVIEGLRKIDKLRSKELNSIINKGVFNARGANKTCSYFGGQKVYAMLKSNSPSTERYQKCKLQKVDGIMRINRELINRGACVPKLYSIFFADENYIEIFERAKGDVLAVARLDSFVKKTCGVSLSGNKKCGAFLKQKIGRKIYEHNLKQQNIAKNLPQECYDKLFNSLCIINDMDMAYDDTHSENVMVSEKGFTLVDLNYDAMLNKNARVSDETLVKHLFEPFSFATTYSEFLTKKQINELNKNNLIIAKKLINAVSNKGILINDSFNYLFDSVGQVVSMETMIDNFDDLFASQIALRKLQHKPQMKSLKL